LADRCCAPTAALATYWKSGSMFHSAAVRLTLWYLAIIMAISIIFSGMLYRLSADQLDRNVNRQIGYFNNFLGPRENDNYAQLRQAQVNEDRSHLRTNLIIFNLLVLAGGGAASYLLARRTLEPIEEALKSQTRFAADASHELRTPLTAIQTENEVALRDPKLSKVQAVGLLRSNLEEIAKLKALSEGLLRLANGGGRTADTELLEINDIAEAAAGRLAKTARLKKIKIINKTGKLAVRGERDSLIELLSILIDNAIKYSPSGSQVILSSQKHHKEAQIKIIDKGQGISAAELPHIFERFYRSEGSRSKSGSGGYGLGLAIAKKITDSCR
jgi:two-component system sensor histidine kinase CiaH